MATKANDHAMQRRCPINAPLAGAGEIPNGGMDRERAIRSLALRGTLRGGPLEPLHSLYGF